jgi:branched-subunit amino acid transport protein
MIIAIAVGIIGLLTYLMRLSSLASSRQIPPHLQEWLRFVPIAVLTALIAPDLIGNAHGFKIDTGDARLVGGIIAILVAWRTRNVLLTLAAGMGVVWILQAVLPA